jgi:cytochrome c oxidase assembly factor CtaG
VQTGGLDLLADAIEGLALGAYAAAIVVLRSRGRRWPWTSTGAFVAGIGALWIAVGSGVAAYDEVNVSLHVAQHVALMMVAAPLLAVGRPVTLVAQTARRPTQGRIVRLANGAFVGWLSHPIVITTLYYGTMAGYFLTPVYGYSVFHPLFHDATHASFLAIGYLYWQPLVGGDPSRRRLSYPARILTLVVGGPVEALLGVALVVLPYRLSPANSVAQTNDAGRLFLILAMLVTGLWTGYVLASWLRRSVLETKREDRRAAAIRAASQLRAEELGATGVAPAGWYVPPWRLVELEGKSRIDRGI